MRLGAKSSDLTENSRGAGPATSAPLAYMANEKSEIDEHEEDEAAKLEIDHLFRRRISGLRRLPRRERPHALRAAREWRMLALKALRERKAAARHARYMLRQLLKPKPV
jgi:hypothetical protein